MILFFILSSNEMASPVLGAVPCFGKEHGIDGFKQLCMFNRFMDYLVDTFKVVAFLPFKVGCEQYDLDFFDGSFYGVDKTFVNFAKDVRIDDHQVEIFFLLDDIQRRFFVEATLRFDCPSC